MRFVRKLSLAAVAPVLALALAVAFSPVEPTVEAAGADVVNVVESAACRLDALLGQAASLLSWVGLDTPDCA